MIEPFAMERMQSTWENLVDYDMSESGVRPLTLRELVEMGFDLDAFLDQPLGYSQSNGTVELRERIAALYPGQHRRPHRGDQRHVRGELPRSRSALLRPGDAVAMEAPNYMQMPGVVRSLGATVQPFHLRQDSGWEPDWDEFERAVTPGTRLLYLSNPNNPDRRRAVGRRDASASWIDANRPGRGSSPTRSISAPRSIGRARAASGA